MQRTHGQFRVIGRDQHADLDLAGGNHLDVDRLVGERAEHGVGDAGMAAHPGADHADFGYRRIGDCLGMADLWLRRRQSCLRPRQIGRADGEGKVRHAVGRQVLHDHVDIDVVFRQRAKNRRRDARPVRNTPQGDLRFVAGIGDPRYNLFFHDLVLIHYQGAGIIAVERIGEIHLHEAR